jgi:hypothetical protein
MDGCLQHCKEKIDFEKEGGNIKIYYGKQQKRNYRR